MFADADHEIIDSPEALFRHLYEEHGVEEARDLDPGTAPLQFWLRRHTELERAQRTPRRQPEPAPPPRAEPPRAEPPRAEPSRAEPRPRAEPRTQAAPRSQPPAPGRDGRRPAGFGDPLVEAVARALAGRGYDEGGVRSAIRSFAGTGGEPAGEPGVRAVFVEPMLQSVAERLLGAPGPPRPAATPPPTREEPPRPAAPPPAREEPARPEAAWAVLWADLADTGRRPGEGGGAAGDDGDDLMAVANAVQARRRVRLLRR
jgi:hypothetical protein